MKRKASRDKIHKSKNIKRKNDDITKVNEILELVGLKSDDNNKIKKNEPIYNPKEIKPDKNKEFNSYINLSPNQSSNNNIILKNSHIINSQGIRKIGLVNKEFFLNNIKENIKYKQNDFHLEDVEGDGNCGYRCISLQLYGLEDNYHKIRESVYNYLNQNKNLYTDYTFEYNGNIISSDEYIDIIRNNQEWMGELEIITIAHIYDLNIMLFQKNEKDEIYLLNKYGNFNIKENLLLTLCYVNNNHFNILYEKQKDINNNFNNFLVEKESLEGKLFSNKKQNNIAFKYANDIDKVNKYEDIKNFVINKQTKGIYVFPNYINNIINKTERHTKKTNFKRACEKYRFDFKINRLTKITSIIFYKIRQNILIIVLIKNFKFQ